jgi:hypothetical protein
VIPLLGDRREGGFFQEKESKSSRYLLGIFRKWQMKCIVIAFLL